MEEPYSLICPVQLESGEGLLGTVNGILRTESEMERALEMVPDPNLPKGYRPAKLAEFSDDKIFSKGTFVLVMYESSEGRAFASHFFGKDFGYGIMANILNHKTEEVNVNFNLTLDYIIPNFLDTTDKFKETIPPDLPVSLNVGLVPCYPDGIKYVSITVEAENIKVSRTGFSIRNFVILFK